MGGSMVGQTKVMENNINIVNSFCQPNNYAINPIVSRSTIRELSRNPEWEWYENYLHAARMNLLILGMEYDEALEFLDVYKRQLAMWFEYRLSTKYVNCKNLFV